MTQVQDNWYSFTITKYSEAKVMFNSSSNQIPAQNQPGLDAKGVMWYKNGIWCDNESDTDRDELPDYMELVLGTDITKIDTDGDGLTNLKEYQLGTNPTNEDSDSDGLKDGEEVNTYKTDPLKKDTDGNTLSDGDDVALGFSPLLKDTDNNGILDCDEKVQQSFTQEIECEDKPQVTDVSVSFKGNGNINSTTTVTSIYNIDMLSTNLVGLVGSPVEIETESSFDEAVIKFKLDKTKLGNVEFENLGILWYDEENDLFKMQDTTLDETNSTVSATVTHFSKYMVVDKKAWFDTWQHEIVYDSEIEDIQTVLAIDCSGSMAWNDPNTYHTNEDGIDILTNYRKLACESYIDSMRTYGDMISLVTFTFSANVVVPMTNNKNKLKAGLSSISSAGGTDCDSAVQTALLQFNYNNTESSNKIILLLTDGEDSVPDTILQSAVDKGVKIYTVGIGKDINQNILQHIADYTGGKFYIAKQASEIIDIYYKMGIEKNIDPTDTDGDGLPDVVESSGMRLSNGEIIYTDPLNSDTDSDGLRDGEEITLKKTKIFKYQKNDKNEFYETECYGYQFFINSNPNMSDSDGDGIGDKIDTMPTILGISDLLDDANKQNLIQEITPYINEDLSFIQGFVNKRSIEQAIDIIYLYDKIITNSSNYFLMPKAYIQSVLFRELMFENISDDIADSCVIITYNYLFEKEIYDNLDKYSKLLVTTPTYPVLYKEDSSTGLGQIFASTAINSLNYINKKNHINIYYSYDNFRERFIIWSKLKYDNEYNVSMISNVIMYGTNDINLDDKNFLTFPKQTLKLYYLDIMVLEMKLKNMEMRFIDIMRFLVNTINFKRITIVFVFIFLLITIIIFLNYINSYLYVKQKNIDANIPLSDTCGKYEVDVYDNILVLCDEFITDKPLTCVITNISEERIEFVFYFVKYIDNSAEGGRINATEVYVNMDKRIITKIKFFNGSSKQYGISCTPISNFEILNYQNVINNYNITNDNSDLTIKYTYNSAKIF